MELKKYSRKLRHTLSLPIIFGMIIPLIMLDICMEIYHHICFTLYGLPLIKRKKYIKIDRHKLKYLTWLEKIGCVYCGYGNGLIHYVSIITGETEKYWCGIKHKKDSNFIEPKHHKRFLKYGDKIQYNKTIKKKNKKEIK